MIDVSDLNERIVSAVERSGAFIEELTVDSAVNRPSEIVKSGSRFFSWDNEHRSKENGKPYLYSWSYYNGVIFEGLKYICDKTKDDRYLPYICEFLDAMITDGELNEHAGYVPHHGVDCYKTASLLALLCGYGEYEDVCAKLYGDLTVINAAYAEEALGGNYWHMWASKKPPKYKVWLDGIYMTQPFLARYAKRIGDREQQKAIFERFCWVAENLRAENGLFYHAGNRKDDICPFFWLRAIGWYAMAQVDVMEYLPEEYLPRMKQDLKIFIDGMLGCQDASGMWRNLVDQPLSESNRTESSGSAMMIYCILKAIRLGFLEDADGSYKRAAQAGFCTLAEDKLTAEGLKDIYLMAAASGADNYGTLEWYKTNEGKGIGPFIMAYSEMIKTID